MESEIQQLPWMGEDDQAAALEKLHAVVNKIGYPGQMARLQLHQDRARRLSRQRGARHRFSNRGAQLAKIGKPVDRTEWQMTPPTVNAYYDPQMNDINFPAGVLQPPLFDPKSDDAPNFGDTGATIGHELTHAFDDEGRQFDATGNLQELVDQEGRARNSRSAPSAFPISIRNTPWSTTSRSTAS